LLNLDRLCNVIINYILKIVPNSSNCKKKFWKRIANVRKCSITLFKLYQIHCIMLLIPEMYVKDTKCLEMFQYTFQIVPYSSNYTTNPGNVQTGYKMLGNVPLHFLNCTKFITFCYLPRKCT
jgi:hypothetical protein